MPKKLVSRNDIELKLVTHADFPVHSITIFIRHIFKELGSSKNIKT